MISSEVDVDASRKRLEIMNKAAELFDEFGYQDTNMERIALAVGIKKPTLYHYFKSKAEILYLISDRLIALLTDRHLRRLETPMPPDQVLLEMIADILELMETHPGHVRVFLEFQRELPAGQRGELARKRNAYQAMLKDILAAGVAAGTFRQVDERLATLGIFGMVNWSYQWFSEEGPLRPREIAYVLWDILLRGLKAPDESAVIIPEHRQAAGA